MVPPKGTWACRWDPVLSFLNIMRGTGHGLIKNAEKFPFAPGRIAPAWVKEGPDRGQCYCYGSLAAVPKEELGHWPPSKMFQDGGFANVQDFLSEGVITILQVSSLKAGSLNPVFAQWARNGFAPQNGYVIGAIIPPSVNIVVAQAMKNW